MPCRGGGESGEGEVMGHASGGQEGCSSGDGGGDGVGHQPDMAAAGTDEGQQCFGTGAGMCEAGGLAVRDAGNVVQCLPAASTSCTSASASTFVAVSATGGQGNTTVASSGTEDRAAVTALGRIYQVPADVLVATVAQPALALASALAADRGADSTTADESGASPLIPARLATLADVPSAWLCDLSAHGFTALHLVGVWATGWEGLAWAQATAGASSHSSSTTANDSGDGPGSSRVESTQASPYSIVGYTVRPEVGGNPGLRMLKARAEAAGLKVLLDFVPAYTASDHPWTRLAPWLYEQQQQQQGMVEGGDTSAPLAAAVTAAAALTAAAVSSVPAATTSSSTSLPPVPPSVGSDEISSGGVGAGAAQALTTPGALSSSVLRKRAHFAVHLADGVQTGADRVVWLARGHDLTTVPHFSLTGTGTGTGTAGLWPDTAMLNYTHPATRALMVAQIDLLARSGLCHGLRVHHAALCLSALSTPCTPPLEAASLPGPGTGAHAAWATCTALTACTEPVGTVPPYTGSTQASPSGLCVADLLRSGPCPLMHPSSSSISDDTVEFWPAAIAAARSVDPTFLFVGDSTIGACPWSVLQQPAPSPSTLAPAPAPALAPATQAGSAAEGDRAANRTDGPTSLDPLALQLLHYGFDAVFDHEYRAAVLSLPACTGGGPGQGQGAAAASQATCAEAKGSSVCPLHVSLPGQPTSTSVGASPGPLAQRLERWLESRDNRGGERLARGRTILQLEDCSTQRLTAALSSEAAARSLTFLTLLSPWLDSHPLAGQCREAPHGKSDSLAPCVLIHHGQLEGHRLQHSLTVTALARPVEQLPSLQRLHTLLWWQRALALSSTWLCPNTQWRWTRVQLTPSKDGNGSFKHILAWVVTPDVDQQHREREKQGAATSMMQPAPHPPAPALAKDATLAAAVARSTGLRSQAHQVSALGQQQQRAAPRKSAGDCAPPAMAPGPPTLDTAACSPDTVAAPVTRIVHASAPSCLSSGSLCASTPSQPTSLAGTGITVTAQGSPASLGSVACSTSVVSTCTGDSRVVMPDLALAAAAAVAAVQSTLGPAAVPAAVVEALPGPLGTSTAGTEKDAGHSIAQSTTSTSVSSPGTESSSTVGSVGSSVSLDTASSGGGAQSTATSASSGPGSMTTTTTTSSSSAGGVAPEFVSLPVPPLPATGTPHPALPASVPAPAAQAVAPASPASTGTGTPGSIPSPTDPMGSAPVSPTARLASLSGSGPPGCDQDVDVSFGHAPAPALPSRSAHTAYVLAVNLCDTPSNGHLLLLPPAEEGAGHQEGPAEGASEVDANGLASWLARRMAGPVGVLGAALPVRGRAGAKAVQAMLASAARSGAHLGFVDHLSTAGPSTTSTYPLSSILAEGWWVSMQPWAASAWEIQSLCGST